MGLTVKQRRVVTQELASRYRGASRSERSKILDEFVPLTGLTRNYAAWLLRKFGTKRVVKIDGEWLETVVGGGRKKPVKRDHVYNEQVKRTLTKLWKQFDFMCGQRLAPMLKELVPMMVGHGELHCSKATQEKLVQISPATVDRLLGEEKQRMRIRPRSLTKPTSILKAQIPMRTWSDAEVDEPGHMEIDLVGHDGGVAQGEYCYSLDCVDLATGWVEPRALLNRAQRWTLDAIKTVRTSLPFELKSIHSDNGSEFINTSLLGWTQRHQIQFTRSRPYRKNDNAHVEQKNYSVIRQAVGYARFDGLEERELIAELYEHLRLLVNHFYPSAKLKTKRREGAKVYKKHDTAQSPYQRLMNSNMISNEVKQQIQHEHRRIRPLRLKNRITELQNTLYDRARRKDLDPQRRRVNKNESQNAIHEWIFK